MNGHDKMTTTEKQFAQIIKEHKGTIYTVCYMAAAPCQRADRGNRGTDQAIKIKLSAYPTPNTEYQRVSKKLSAPYPTPYPTPQCIF